MYIWIWELRGFGILGQGVYETGEGNGKLVYEQPGYEVDGSCDSKEGSKEVKRARMGSKRERG
jgi:hypothetical protein